MIIRLCQPQQPYISHVDVRFMEVGSRAAAWIAAQGFGQGMSCMVVGNNQWAGQVLSGCWE
jgi:hypothetical protein